jgi:hypothetical protein
MLTTLTRKLCPLLSLAIFTLGCGKEISEPETQLGRTRDNQEIPSTFVLRLDGTQTSKKVYYMPEDASFKIPDRLNVKSGATNGKMVEIIYQIDKYDSEYFQFGCSYVPSINSTEMLLQRCFDYENNDFGDVSRQIFALYKNDSIQLKFKDSSRSDLIIEAIYNMNWIIPRN